MPPPIQPGPWRGRAPEWHSGGQGFELPWLHHRSPKPLFCRDLAARKAVCGGPGLIHKPSTLSLGGMGRPAHDFV